MIRASWWLVLMLASPAAAADWPGFRGTDGNAAAAARPPLQWNEQQGLKWKTPLPGPGSSSPIVVGPNVFVTCYSGYGVDGTDPGKPVNLQRHLLCINRTDGAIRWTATVPAVQPEDPYRGYLTEHGYASSTPVSDGEAVYVFFGKSGVLAFDMEGKKLWQQSVGTESDIRGWGSAASPVLYKNLVIVNAASEDRALVALDKKTGKVVWKAEGNKLSLSFSTPALVAASPTRTDLVAAMPGEVWGLDPDKGKLRWHSRITPDGNVSPTVVAGEGVAYLTGGFQSRGTAAVKVGGEGDVTKTHTVWSSRQSSYVPTPVLHDGRLYCVTDAAMALCLQADTGAVVYEERLTLRSNGRGGKGFYASLVRAGDRLYATSRRAGVYVLATGPKFQQLAHNPPLDDTDFNGTPAIVDRQLFLRSNRFLYCLEEGAVQATSIGGAAALPVESPGGIAWYATLERGLAEARRTGKPILFLSAAPHCGGISGIW